MAASGPQPSFLATRRGKFTLILLAAVGFLDFVDASIVNIALPSAQADLDISNADRQWMITAYTLAFGALLLLGRLAARFRPPTVPPGEDS